MHFCWVFPTSQRNHWDVGNAYIHLLYTDCFPNGCTLDANCWGREFECSPASCTVVIFIYSGGSTKKHIRSSSVSCQLKDSVSFLRTEGQPGPPLSLLELLLSL